MRQFLHLGCGPCIHRSPTCTWVNVDIEESHNPDIAMDYLKMAERFPAASFDGCCIIHSLEHLQWPEGVQTFFRECRKVLKPGGILRIVVPDLGLIARKYVNGESLKDVYDGPYFTYKDLPATRFLWWARGWEHSILFDEQLLREFATDAGWQNFRVMPFGVSQLPEMCGLDRFQTESISVECMA